MIENHVFMVHMIIIVVLHILIVVDLVLHITNYKTILVYVNQDVDINIL